MNVASVNGKDCNRQVSVRKHRGVTYARDDVSLLTDSEYSRIVELTARPERSNNDLRVFPRTAGHHEIVIHNPFMVHVMVSCNDSGGVSVSGAAGSDLRLQDIYFPAEDFDWVGPIVHRSVDRLIQAFPEAAEDLMQPVEGTFTLLRYYLTPGVRSRGAHWHDDRFRWMSVTLVESAPGSSPASLLLAPVGKVARDTMRNNHHTVDPGAEVNRAVYFNGEAHLHRVKRFDMRHLASDGPPVQRIVLQQKFKKLA